ncbi:MAG: apolipoprotein N-acyltransferase [Bacteroidota bacterium]
MKREAPWLLGALAYGLAWPQTGGPVLPFLAWGAWVPLLLALREERSWRVVLLRAYGFTAVAALVSGWWWFVSLPAAWWGWAWLAALHEIALASAPFVAVALLHRRLPFDRAVWLLVPLVPLWEAVYTLWPLSMRNLVVGYSQASLPALIQFADLGGVWLVSAWIIALNVGLYQSWRAPSRRWLRAGLVLLLGVGGAWGYGLLKGVPEGATTIRALLLHTNAHRDASVPVDTLIARTAARLTNGAGDMVAWPEGLLASDAQVEQLEAVVQRWGVPLLAGQSGRDATGRLVNQMHLLVPTAGERSRQSYQKRHLVPMWEGLPFAHVTRHVPGVDTLAYYHPGTAPTLLRLPQGEHDVAVAAPICHEQGLPSWWAAFAQNGADLFVQGSYERWFGTRSFHVNLANQARLRAIETGRSVARVTHGGQTVVFDARGRIIRSHIGATQAMVVEVPIYARQTLFATQPTAFPVLCCLILVIGLAIGVQRSRRSDSLRTDGAQCPET